MRGGGPEQQQWKDSSVPSAASANCPGLQVGGLGGGGGAGRHYQHLDQSLKDLPWPWQQSCPQLGAGKGIAGYSSHRGNKFHRKWLNWYLMVDWGLGGGAEWGLF